MRAETDSKGGGASPGEAPRIISCSYLNVHMWVTIYRWLYIVVDIYMGDSRRSLLRRCKACLLIPLPGLFVGGSPLKCYQKQLCMGCMYKYRRCGACVQRMNIAACTSPTSLAPSRGLH